MRRINTGHVTEVLSPPELGIHPCVQTDEFAASYSNLHPIAKLWM